MTQASAAGKHSLSGRASSNALKEFVRPMLRAIAIVSFFLLFPLQPYGFAQTDWRTAWAASPSEPATPDMELGGSSIVQVIRLTAGGSKVRLRLSNTTGTAPITIEAIRMDGQPVLVDGKDRINIPSGMTIWTDPVQFNAEAGETIRVAFRIPDPEALPTIHWYSGGDGKQRTAYSTRALPHRVVVSAVDVAGGEAPGTIVAVGDSLTDGSTAPPGELGRWPDVMSQLLQKAGIPFAVANAGIGGDRLLADAAHTGSSPGILGRLDQDVFALSEPKAVILLAGTNDIGWPGATLNGRPLAPLSAMPEPDDLIMGYRQTIQRARDRGVLIVLGTIPPLNDRGTHLSGFGGVEKDRIRNIVNDWIRTQTEADGVIDFDLVLRSPDDLDALSESYDSGDGIHPNEEGYRQMGIAAADTMMLVLEQLNPP
jgi:lysophospholipase L1-like esterase